MCSPLEGCTAIEATDGLWQSSVYYSCRRRLMVPLQTPDPALRPFVRTLSLSLGVYFLSAEIHVFVLNFCQNIYFRVAVLFVAHRPFSFHLLHGQQHSALHEQMQSSSTIWLRLPNGYPTHTIPVYVCVVFVG